jgi:DMSO/TMAO reductase YedYZ molybdopterin-dependent catalytic subunit
MEASSIARSVAGFAVAWLTAASVAVPAQAQGPGPTTLSVRGNVEHVLTLSIDDLKQLPVQRIEDVRVVRPTGSASTVPDVTRRYTGCLLRDVLERAKPVEKNRLDLRSSVVILTASDGYRAIFSWAELYLSPIGDSAVVVYERDGVALPADEGPLALVSQKDTRPVPVTSNGCSLSSFACWTNNAQGAAQEPRPVHASRSPAFG